MDDYEQGLITGAVLVALIFGIVFLQIWLDARRNARINAQWLRTRLNFISEIERESQDEGYRNF